MSGGEPLWRRVAGLYLSGIPNGERDRMSTRLNAAARAAEVATDPKQEIVLLGEALDLITLAQGYTSPAVPMLLRALIRAVRQFGGVPGTEAGAETAPPAAAEKAEETPQPAAETAAAPAPEPVSEAPAPAPEAKNGERYAVLEERFQETDRKVAALTAAVGQLVDVLQRRVRDGGGVDRRTSPRIPGGNARLYVRGTAYPVVNWSPGGFLIRIAEADRFGRGGFHFHFILELSDETIEFQGRAIPVRIERALLAAEFAGLDAATATKLSEVATRLAAAPV